MWLQATRNAWENRKSNESFVAPAKPKFVEWHWSQGYGMVPTVSDTDVPLSIPAEIAVQIKRPPAPQDTLRYVDSNGKVFIGHRVNGLGPFGKTAIDWQPE